jgi:hypothetical protein
VAIARGIGRKLDDSSSPSADGTPQNNVEDKSRLVISDIPFSFSHLPSFLDFHLFASSQCTSHAIVRRACEQQTGAIAWKIFKSGG